MNVPVRPDDGSVRIFTGFRVPHTVSRGPANGCLRDAPTGSIDDVRALARWMSWKCALVGSPLGGAQGGATCDPRTVSLTKRERLTRRFATELSPILGEEIDLPAPDLGTGPQQPAWFNDTRSMHMGQADPGVVLGKPMGIGGSEGRGEVSGRGVLNFFRTAGGRPAFPLATARVVVQRLGNVGATTATLGATTATLGAASGATVVGVSDSDGGISNPAGTGPDRIDINALADHVQRQESVAGLPGCRAQSGRTRSWHVHATSWSRPRSKGTFRHRRRSTVRATSFSSEGANGPTTPDADQFLKDRGITVVPDILCTSGGVIDGSFEWVHDLPRFSWSGDQVGDQLGGVMSVAFTRLWDRSLEMSAILREAALDIAIKRVADALAVRGPYP